MRPRIVKAGYDALLDSACCPTFPCVAEVIHLPRRYWQCGANDKVDEMVMALLYLNMVQGGHPLQTSDALGAAVQVGPEALTLGVLMNKAQGLPHADAAAILKQGFHLQMGRSGICRAIQRVARKAEATWHALRDAARRSQLAHMDETGWKVEAQLRWLWAAVTEQITYCEILPGRGFAEAASILGAEYAGWLIHDGLQIYYAMTNCRERLGGLIKYYSRAA